MKVIIGCGNLLLKDEGVGVHLIEYLKKINLPKDIELVDGGTAGLDLLPFIKDAEKVVIIDAVCAGGSPGEIYCFNPSDFETDSSLKVSLHDVTLKDVFRIMQKLGPVPKIRIIGIEPEDMDIGTDLSPDLKEKLPKLAELALKVAQDA
jgi:hydrogenase maturation protease